jgi:hypothetical protein
MIEILDQDKAFEQPEAMVNVNIDIFKYIMNNLFITSSVERTWGR